MVVKKLINKLPINSDFMRLFLGAVLVALLISLGMVGVFKLLGMPVNPTVPSVFASIGAAIYAAGTKR
jgi:phosphate/sulfate permease